MITVLNDKQAAAKYLSADFYENLNAINYLKNIADSKACIFDSNINNGIIVAHNGGKKSLPFPIRNIVCSKQIPYTFICRPVSPVNIMQLPYVLNACELAHNFF